MTKIRKIDLTKVAQFAVNDSMGEDSWTLYTVKGKPHLGVAYFSQSVRGWESERWYLFNLNKHTTSTYQKIMSLDDQAQQCKLMNDFPKDAIVIEE